MTEELEKEAEEYLIKRLRIDIDEFEKWKENNGGEVKFAIDCYIAGAKAHLPRWHDLRKDPNDLPKTNDDVVCYCGKGWRLTIGKYWKEYQKFEVDGVIKWCETPESEEEND